MSASAEKSRVAVEKKELVRELLAKGKSATACHKAVKKKYGSGIASRDVIDLRRELEAKETQRVDSFKIAPLEARETHPVRPFRTATPPPVVSAATIELPPMRRFILKYNGSAIQGVQFPSGRISLDTPSGTSVSLEWLDP